MKTQKTKGGNARRNAIPPRPKRSGYPCYDVMTKNRFWFFTRIFTRIMFVTLVPFILSIIIFNPFEKIPLQEDKIGNVTVFRVSKEVISQPSIKNIIRDIFSVPFDLKWYYICFVNNGTKLVYEDGEINKNASVSINFNNQTLFSIPYGETKCTTTLYMLDKDFQPPNYIFAYPITFGQIRKFSLYYSAYSYAKPETKGIFAKIILFIISCWGLILLLSEMYKFVKFGCSRKA